MRLAIGQCSMQVGWEYQNLKSTKCTLGIVQITGTVNTNGLGDFGARCYDETAPFWATVAL